MLSLELVY